MSSTIDNLTLSRNLESLRRYAGSDLLAALSDPNTCEIMLNHDGKLWCERFGEPMQVIGTMTPSKAETFMRQVTSCLDKELTRESPQVDGELLLDGSRFSGVFPPVVSAPCFAIRKKASRVFLLSDYVEAGTLSSSQYDFLCDAIGRRRNILVVGGTGSGKTTLLNGLIAEMVRQDSNQRFFVIEDTGEIQCKAPNAVLFHTTSTVSMTDCLKQALRFRPDRILVGEVRDHAALDMLDAWNTGHEGGAATLHANSARLALSRVRGLVSRNPYAPKAIEEVIGEAVHLIVFITKTPQGRKVKELLEVRGYDHHSGEYDLKPVG